MKTFSRRNLLKTLPCSVAVIGFSAGLIGSSPIFGLDPPMKRRKRFVLHVDFGSRCGWSSGLLQPTDVGIYPRGSFYSGQAGSSPNPNMNLHYKDGGLVFHDYSKPMLRHSAHMCFAVTNPVSISHGEADSFQTTGNGVFGPAGNPSFGVGIIQAMMSANKGEEQGLIVDFNGGQTVRGSSATPQVSAIATQSYAQFIAKFSDPTTVPNTPNKVVFNKLQKELSYGYYGGGAVSAAQAKALDGTLGGLLSGVPNAGAAWDQIGANITAAKVESEVRKMVDGEATMATSAGLGGNNNPILEAFRLAALLIETASAQGLGITLDGQDFHGGSAQVTTARSSGQLWAHLSVFWDWVVAKGLQDDVLVIVGQEFARTPANGNVIKMNVVGNAGPQEVTTVGTDHQPICGIALLHGKVPPKARIGCTIDSFLPQASKDLRGTSTGDGVAYNSMQVMGTMMMRLYPDLYPNHRVLRDTWSNFTEGDIIQNVLA